MNEKNDTSPVHECVQPELGDQIWRLEDPTTAPDLAERLNRHLGVCDGCRMTLAVGDLLADGAASGGVKLDGDDAPRRIGPSPTFLNGAGITALAASLVLLFVMPPRDLAGGRWRSGDAPAFHSPLEGEVLLDRTPELSWSPIEGATAYELTVNAGEDYAWTERTSEPRATVPTDRPLPDGVDVRALVAPVPADLAPVGEVSVSFRRGGAADFVADRVRRAPVAPALLAALGAGLVFTGLLRRRTLGSV